MDILNELTSFEELSKNYVKKVLKTYVDNPLVVGQNFIKICKTSEKWITMTESRNGLVQEHRRNTINTILDYMLYKKTLFFRDASETTDIDPSKQSKQYQLQHDNFIETKQDFQTHLELIFKQYTSLVSFTIDESLDSVFITVNRSQKVKISLQKDDLIQVSTDVDLSEVHQQSTYNFFKAYSKILSLVYETSKESIHFMITLKQLLMFKKQLKLLVSFVNTDCTVDNDEQKIKEKIKHFIKTATKDDRLELAYEDFDSLGRIFKRSVVIQKATKIRTLFKVFASVDDIYNPTSRFVEFSKTFTKMHQDYDRFTNEMYNLYLANK
jgi:hypothetical protein